MTLLRFDSGSGSLRAAAQLGGGYINLGGVFAEGNTLSAATMSGLLRRRADGGGEWQAVVGAAPGKDVTAVARAGDGLWIASRRGLSRVQATPPAPP